MLVSVCVRGTRLAALSLAVSRPGHTQVQLRGRPRDAQVVTRGTGRRLSIGLWRGATGEEEGSSGACGRDGAGRQCYAIGAIPPVRPGRLCDEPAEASHMVCRGDGFRRLCLGGSWACSLLAARVEKGAEARGVGCSRKASQSQLCSPHPLLRFPVNDDWAWGAPQPMRVLRVVRPRVTMVKQSLPLRRPWSSTGGIGCHPVRRYARLCSGRSLSRCGREGKRGDWEPRRPISGHGSQRAERSI